MPKLVRKRIDTRTYEVGFESCATSWVPAATNQGLLVKCHDCGSDSFMSESCDLLICPRLRWMAGVAVLEFTLYEDFSGRQPRAHNRNSVAYELDGVALPVGPAEVSTCKQIYYRDIRLNLIRILGSSPWAQPVVAFDLDGSVGQDARRARNVDVG
jgi:hypothetical protein